jgi:hypothetical protein
MARRSLPLGALRGVARAIQAVPCPTTKRRARSSSNGLASSSSASTPASMRSGGAFGGPPRDSDHSSARGPHPVQGCDRVLGICAACKYLAFSWPACIPASTGVTLVTAPTSRIARIMRPVLGAPCWAAVMALANAWLQCAVSGPARPGLSAITRCGNWHVRCVERARGRAGARTSE